MDAELISRLERKIATDLADGDKVTAVVRITQLIRAVIADETPNIVKAMLNTPIEHTTVNLDGKTICTYPVAPDGEAAKPQPAEPRADGDVPEWFTENIYLHGNVSRERAKIVSPVIWDKVRSDFARRVTEATAERDRRIAELEKERDNYKRLFDDAIDAVDEVFQTRSDRDPPILPNFCPLGTSKFRAVVKLAKEYKSLKQQLSTATAEVERLTEVVEVRGRDMDQMESELTTLRQQLAEATKPVEDERSFFASDANGDASEVVGVLQFRRERAARVAAESERDAANVLIDEVIDRLKADGHDMSTTWCWKRESYRKLVAYRAEKGGVRT